MRACLCEECFNSLLELIRDGNQDVKFNDREPHVSGHTPCLELSYYHENGHEYTIDIYASANYCCECGESI